MFHISLPAKRIATERMRWRLLATFRNLAVFAFSALLAFELRFDNALPVRYFYPAWIALCIWAVAKSITFAIGEANRVQWQNTSIYDAQRIALANSAGSVLGGLIIVALLGPWGIPRSVYILEWIISCFLLLGGRLIMRSVATTKDSQWATGKGTKTLIYGAGTAGLQLLRELRQNRSLMSEVVGFIDDNSSKVGLILDGKRVLGKGKAIEDLVRRYEVKRVVIAIPSATGGELVRILKLVSDAGVEYKMVPSLGDLIRGKEGGGQIRNISAEDLLGRESVQLDLGRIRERIQGKVVMVTGAAGSIGSELCRQIANFYPLALIGFDEAETPLFHLDRELRSNFPGIGFHPVIGNITQSEHLRYAMERFQPSILYHAAAYKHVALMETQVFAAVENNVLGTWQTALAAINYRVEDFVMISTDKAVHPTSIMGATKRMAELVIRSLQSVSGTRFFAVRFGNVLGSDGSVVPIFKEQIAAGGPVTVTHPEMRRYFMTITEASQLVLQAFSMGRGGDVFHLDMGDPVKIVDLARNLILLSGLIPDQDIKIQFTGIRPGEKLFEELNLHNESMLPTLHTKIRRYASPAKLDVEQLMKYLHKLQDIVERRDLDRLMLLLKFLIPDYAPGTQLLEDASVNHLSRVDAVEMEVPFRKDHSLISKTLAPTAEVP